MGRCCALLPDFKVSAAHGIPGQSLAPLHSLFWLKRCTEHDWGIAGGGTRTGVTGPEGPWGILILWRAPEMQNHILCIENLILNGETEAPPACGGRIKSYQACPSPRAELLVSAQKVLAALCLGVVLSISCDISFQENAVSLKD